MLKNKGLKLIISKKEIARIVKRLAKEIKRDYDGKNPVLIGALKGSVVFLSDLIRELDMPLQMDFVRITCYGMRDRPLKKVCVIKDMETDITERDVVIVEDIVDRGVTIKELIRYIKSKNPASLKLCALLLRDGGKGVHYFGKKIGKGFVVGYGMDYKERYRNLPAIYMRKAQHHFPAPTVIKKTNKDGGKWCWAKDRG